MATSKKVVIIGSGTAGLSVTGQLLNNYPDHKFDITLIDPSSHHYYQPLWTLVGAGVFKKEESERAQKDLIPPQAQWIQQAVASFQPDKNQVTLDNGETVTYDALVVAAGIQIDWDKIEGLKETLGKNGVCSNYAFDLVDKTWETLRSIRSGRAIFTQPAMPIKCAGAPQKAMYMSEDYLRKHGLRDKVEVNFALPSPGIFGVPKYKAALEKVLERKGVQPWYQHNLIKVDGVKRVASFLNSVDQSIKEVEFNMLHVVPPMSSPNFIKSSPLADAEGWVDVDKYTLQHNRYQNVWSLGDCSSLPTSRTGAAIRKQAPVLAGNLVKFFDKEDLSLKYNGYASCPLVTGYGSCILAEFGYDGAILETFPFDQAQERFSMYMMKAYALPKLYWHGMLKGRA